MVFSIHMPPKTILYLRWSTETLGPVAATLSRKFKVRGIIFMVS